MSPTTTLIRVKTYTGNLFVLEGGDGTTKKTQLDLLAARLKAEGHKTAEADFPRYGSPPKGHPASYFVRKYLQRQDFGFTKGYGPALDTNPHAASLAYALDRFDAAFCHEEKPNLWDLLHDGYQVVSNRYTESNIGYQASKIEDPVERKRFIEWLMDLEYRVLGIPKSDLVLLLDLDPAIAIELKARQRKAQGQVLDAHEGNTGILYKAREAYLEAAKLFPDSWVVLDVGTKPSSVNMDILAGVHSKEVVHEMIWAKVKEFLNKG